MAEGKQKIQELIVIEVKAVADGDGVRLIPAHYRVEETEKMYEARAFGKRWLKRKEGDPDIPDESFNLKIPKVKLRLWRVFRITKHEIPQKTEEMKELTQAKVMAHFYQLSYNLNRIAKGLAFGFAENFLKKHT